MIDIPICDIHGVKVKISVIEAKFRYNSIPFGRSCFEKDNTEINTHYMKYYPDSTFYLSDNNKGYIHQGQKTISDKLTDDDINYSLVNSYLNSFDATMSIPKGFQAADKCKHLGLALPTIDVLARIYKYREIIDLKDTTLKEFPHLSIDNILRTSLNIWSSTVGDSSHTWMIRSMGKIGYGRRHYPAGVIPVREICL